MALEVHYATALSVSAIDPQGIVPTTGSAVLYRADGTTLETLSVTLPTSTWTLTGSPSRESFALTSATGIAVGRQYKLTSDGVDYEIEIERVDGSTIYLRSALEVAPDTASTITDLRMTSSIAAPGASEIGTNLRLEWLYDDGTSKGFLSDVVHIVRWKWSAPVTARQVRDFVAVAFPGLASQRSEVYWAAVADRACDRIRRTVESSGRRANLYGESDAFSQAGLSAARLELAYDGVIQPGGNASLYVADRMAEYEMEMRTILSSLATYDADGDGAIDSDEAKGRWFTTRSTR